MFLHASQNSAECILCMANVLLIRKWKWSSNTIRNILSPPTDINLCWPIGKFKIPISKIFITILSSPYFIKIHPQRFQNNVADATCRHKLTHQFVSNLSGASGASYAWGGTAAIFCEAWCPFWCQLRDSLSLNLILPSSTNWLLEMRNIASFTSALPENPQQ